MKIIIDSRMRNEEKEYLKKYGELIEIECQDCVYDEISAHPDIFFCKINGQIFQATNLKLKKQLKTQKGSSSVGKQYPDDVKYNICQIGKKIIHNFKYTDHLVNEYINSVELEKINIKQGYAKCSIAVTSENSCITSDEGIYKTLQKENIDVLLLRDEIIHLQDKNKNITNMSGFIGGSSCIIDNKFILFGDSDKLNSKSKLVDFLNKQKLELIDFKNLEIIDYGGVILT